MHVPDSAPDAAMALVPLAPAEDRLVAGMPARAKARTFLQRSDPSPETQRVAGPFVANPSGENALFRAQLLESHSRVGALTNYLVQAMGMIEERESWWRSIASATLEERAHEVPGGSPGNHKQTQINNH